MEVRVSAPSHVHVGNFDIHGGLGRLYGTIGFTLEEPRSIVRVRSGEGRIEAPSGYYEGWARRAVEVLEGLGCRVDVVVEEVIPRNVGLGATTPLVLSILAGGVRVCGLKASLEELAVASGRSLVSGLGFHSFTHGGFIVDGGFVPGRRRVPPLVFRAEVPGSYTMLVALPEGPVEGILRLKEREDEILARMPQMPEELALRASRIALMGIIANVADGDWEAAGRWITRFNRLLGDYWAERQGGVYCCREAETIIEEMLSSGALLAGQSSWGPTVYGLYREDDVEDAIQRVERVVDSVDGGRVWTSKVDNLGAVIEVVDDG